MPRLRLALFILPLLGSCEAPTGPELVRIEVLQVAAFQVDCRELWGPARCLQVRTHDDESWSMLLGIEGFTHEAGFEYELRVAILRERNPPADGSSITYRLVRELSRVATPPT